MTKKFIIHALFVGIYMFFVNLLSTFLSMHNFCQCTMHINAHLLSTFLSMHNKGRSFNLHGLYIFPKNYSFSELKQKNENSIHGVLCVDKFRVSLKDKIRVSFTIIYLLLYLIIRINKKDIDFHINVFLLAT